MFRTHHDTHQDSKRPEYFWLNPSRKLISTFGSFAVANRKTLCLLLMYKRGWIPGTWPPRPKVLRIHPGQFLPPRFSLQRPLHCAANPARLASPRTRPTVATTTSAPRGLPPRGPREGAGVPPGAEAGAPPGARARPCGASTAGSRPCLTRRRRAACRPTR